MDTSAVEAPVNLRSDNVAGIAPEILAAIEAANAGSAASYGADPITARLQDVFAELFETRCFVQPVATGTATNALALALIAPPYGAIWVRVGDDALLIDQYTGEIIEVDYGVFY